MIKKILGYIFLITSIILVLLILADSSNITKGIIIITRYFFTQSVDDHMLGQAIGGLLANLFIMTIGIVLFIFGKKWIKKKES